MKSTNFIRSSVCLLIAAGLSLAEQIKEVPSKLKRQPLVSEPCQDAMFACRVWDQYCNFPAHLTMQTLVRESCPKTCDLCPANSTSIEGSSPTCPIQRKHSNANRLGRDISQFGMKLYYELVGNDASKNLFFSPSSLSILMSMILAGTAGESKNQIIQNLFSQLGSSEKVIASMRSFHESLTKADNKYDLSSANGVFVENTFDLKIEYENTVAGCLSAEARPADFAGDPEGEREHINKWVETKTNEKIKDLFPTNSITSATRMAVVNSVYFKANWLSKFNASLTKRADFYGGVDGDQQVEVEMMEANKVTLLYSSFPSFHALGMPYEGNDLAMFILLPKERNGLREMEDEIQYQNIDMEILGVTREKEIKMVKIPKFKQELSLDDLMQNLISLGVGDIFDESRADFSQLTSETGLSVSKVVHKAFIEVNEEGTEATAGSGAAILMRSMQMEPIFIANHPFIYLIQDKKTGTILFMGRYVTPPSMETEPEI